MKIENVNLVNKKGEAQTLASVELSNKATGAEYFGIWYKENTTDADVVGWCNKLINQYNIFIQNLEQVKEKSQLGMVRGMSKEQLQAILAGME